MRQTYRQIYRPLAAGTTYTSRRAALGCRVHTSATPQYAEPLPFTAPGPPPPAPEPEPTFQHRSRIRIASLPRPMTTRFWKQVHIEPIDGRLEVILDKRPIRTPAKHVLSVPQSKPLLAHALTLEWTFMRSNQEALKNHLIPLTSLTARAIDLEYAEAAGQSLEATENEKLKGTRKEIVEFLMRYLETDTLLLIAPTNPPHVSAPGDKQVRDVQLEIAREAVAWAKSTLGDGTLSIVISDGDDGILPAKQSDSTLEFLKRFIGSLNNWELVGLERAVLAGKSLLAGLRLVVENRPGGQRRWGVEEAAGACNIELDWQIGQWGSVEDTHDVGSVDVRSQLGSVMLLISDV